MQPRLLKYILDIERIIEEIESIKKKTQNDFKNLSNDIILQRALERDVEIIGEAVRKITEIDPSVKITSAKNIIGLRNIIAHAYDSVEPEILWGIIHKNIPQLAKEIRELKGV